MNRKFAATSMFVVIVLLLGAALALAQNNVPGGQAILAPITTAFTYQGHLMDDESPANGPYDFLFELYDAFSGGNQIGNDVLLNDIDVVDGLFTVELDFGANAFTGGARYLQIGVRLGGSTGSFDIFTERQPLQAAPYASFSATAPWNGLTGVPAGFADGTDNDTTYTSGTGLTLSGTQFSIDTSIIQRRVTGTCNVGEAIRAINNDGTVICVSVSGGGFAWGTVASGSGVGLSLSSSTTWPLYVSGGGSSLTPDIALGGSYGTLSSDPGNSNSRLYLKGNLAVDVVANGSSGISIDTSGGAGSVYIDSGGEIRLDSVGLVDIDAGNRIDISNTSTSQDIFLDAGDDLDLDAADEIYVDAVDDINIDGDRDIVFEMGEVNGVDDYFRIYRHSISSSTKQLEMNEGGDLWISGDFSANGTKSAIVPTESHGDVKLYAMESPENWFEDFGLGQMQNGFAIIEIESVFAETVNLTVDYHVFLTPLGDCPLFVADKTPVSFTVQAMNGENCSISFDYRIVAKRLGYEDIRLEPVSFEDEGSYDAQ